MKCSKDFILAVLATKITASNLLLSSYPTTELSGQTVIDSPLARQVQTVIYNNNATLGVMIDPEVHAVATLIHDMGCGHKSETVRLFVQLSYLDCLFLNDQVHQGIADFPIDDLAKGADETSTWLCKITPKYSYSTIEQEFGSAYIPRYFPVTAFSLIPHVILTNMTWALLPE
ncbi:hypothetical protein F5Y16DRAFT_404796 [Xylariaceae sp. FL0255]|nr:hypothetical protein F5Y16DRAFT_404796 [Xylariaceae sp. FL0255]